jgi:thioredoxin-related protein
MKFLPLTLCLLISQTSSVFAEDKNEKTEKLEWVADYDVATKLASEQNRCVFVLFTNFKVCAPCKILKTNVIDKQEFIDYAEKNLVLLMVDYAPSFDKEAKKELKEIEADKKIPKELWMKGRGPWPYLFVLDPKKEVLYSGVANAEDRKTVQEYLKFLDGLKKP